MNWTDERGRRVPMITCRGWTKIKPKRGRMERLMSYYNPASMRTIWRYQNPARSTKVALCPKFVPVAQENYFLPPSTFRSMEVPFHTVNIGLALSDAEERQTPVSQREYYALHKITKSFFKVISEGGETM